MTEVIEKAKKQLRELEAEIERLRNFIEVYESLSGKKIVETAGDANDSVVGEPTASPAEIAESARALMIQHGRPLTRSMLLKLLRQKGLNLPGQDATKNIGTVIWRSKKFDNIGGWGYWPKDAGRWMGQRAASTEGSEG